MRVSITSMLALPLLAAAVQDQSPLDQVKEHAQYYFDKVQSFVPHFNTYHAAEAAAAKAGGSNIDILTVDNWKNTLQSSVTTTSKGTEEWWVLLTGGNKTCHGFCENLNKAYNESALLFKVETSSPHLAYVNCDHQPILCNSWASGPPTLYIFEVGAPGTPTPLHIVGLNTTSISVKTFQNLKTKQDWRNKPAYEGYFHPFDGIFAQTGTAVPLGWFLWVFAAIPSWMFMIGVSFASRTMMGRRAEPARPRPAGRVGAQPGDGVAM